MVSRGQVTESTPWSAWLGWLLLLVAVADWFALRLGLVPHSPALLAVLVGLTLVGLGTRALGLVWRLGRRDGRTVSRIGELVLVVGVMLALSAGMANWLLRLQGTVILNESEAVPLHGGTALQVFEAGPLSRPEEMGLSLALDALALEPEGLEGFYPASTLEVWRGGDPPTRLRISPRRRAAFGALRFHQGAFGFSPRIVLLRDGVTLFDRVVPFLTQRQGASGVSFDGSFTVERQGLRVEGSVDLTTLDEGMRGHANLLLALTRNGEPLGRGALQPGYFADLDQGYRVGFAGLERWSEIVISRRNYGHLVLAGGVVALGGLVLWPLAVWRRW